MPEGMIDFEVEVTGVMQLQRALAGRIGRLADFRDFFVRLAEDFWAFERRVFAAGGAEEELSGWRALSEQYARWKGRHYADAGILVRTGALRDALTDKGAPGAIYEVGANELRMGADLTTPGGRWNIGLLHQLGTGAMPARPPLRLSKQRTSRWLELLADYVTYAKGA